MAKKDIAQMSDQELMDAWTELAVSAEMDAARLREFSQEHQRRERLKQLNLSEGDMALLQGVEASGIVSDEAVNG